MLDWRAQTVKRLCADGNDIGNIFTIIRYTFVVGAFGLNPVLGLVTLITDFIIKTEIGRKQIPKYIKKYNSRDLGEERIDNIFKYVIPKRIYITQSEEEEFAIMCNYKFDMEHGIAVVYKGGKFKEAGPQDIIL